MDLGAPAAGRLCRVSGPLVEAAGLSGVAMYDVVVLGEGRLLAEVVAVTGARVTLQAYEYTGGLRAGDPVVATGAPLSARLGPGLLGGVFDGLLRPLVGAPDWLVPGHSAPPTARSWDFCPACKAGEPVGEGEALGTVADAGSVEHRVLVPARLGGRVDWMADEGPRTATDPVAVVGGAQVHLESWWPIRQPRPVAQRLDHTTPLVTGQRVLDAVFPVGQGSSAAVPGGFGTGKTVLLQQIAKWSATDVIVYVGCGERGNELADTLAELRELDDPRTGGRLADRTVIIANTSNMPMMAREASIYTGLAVAEYYRDMGHDTVVIADSTSRWAEALREFASRTGALPAEEGYPAGLASALAAFYERAGHFRTLGGREASVTVIGAVSPAGGDMTEPVTAHTQRFVRGLWTLDRDLAYARHYPSISWRSSYSRDVAVVGAWHVEQGDPGWVGRRSRVVALLAEADRLASLAELVGLAALPAAERVVLTTGRLLREAVLQQSALSANDATCGLRKQAALVEMVLAVHERALELVAAGVPATLVEEMDFTPLIRAREEVGADDAAGVAARGDATLAALEELR